MKTLLISFVVILLCSSCKSTQTTADKTKKTVVEKETEPKTMKREETTRGTYVK